MREMALQEAEQPVGDEPDDAHREDERHDPVHGEEFLIPENAPAEAGVAAYELARNKGHPGDAEREPGAVHDGREGGRQHDMRHGHASARAQARGSAQQALVDAADSGQGAHEDRKDGGVEHQEHGHALADAEQQDGDRDPGDGADRPKELHQRVDQGLEHGEPSGKKCQEESREHPQAIA